MNIKKVFSYCCLVMSLGLLTTLMVSATRISDYANSPNDLVKIQQYNTAMERCVKNSLSGFSYDTSGTGEYRKENAQKSYQRLMGKKYFFNSYSGNLIYSEEFEKGVSQGSYDGGVFGSGNNDGKMYCGENNDAIFHNAMRVFGIEENKENLKKLYCDGNNSGIYTIVKKKYDNGKVIEEDSNCADNFDQFVHYYESNILDPEYSITVSVANDPVSHYKKWFSENVGDFKSLSEEQNKALDYAKSVHDFLTLCSPVGPFNSSPGSKSEVMIYDAFSGKATDFSSPVYYTIGYDEAKKSFFTEIDNNKKKTCADIAAEINQEGAEAYATINNSQDPSESPLAPIVPSGNEPVDPTCGNSGGAGSLGWIVCPILQWLARVSEDVYEEYVEPSLQIRPKLFSNDASGRGAYQGWGAFRNIANVLFIILLLFVIFSQLTGVGIDNYGIKKILPKLIVAAILINLSYVICQVCIDLSNILGNGLRGMFDGLGESGEIIFSITSGSDSSGNIAVGTTILTGVALLAAVVLGAAALWANPAIVISLLVSALGIFIAIIFLFVLLAAREAAVIILTVVSPLAFACFILPNTKKLFDKWLKLGQGLLLVYPICGLLVGGGNYVSRLLLNTGYANPAEGGNFITAFTAMIVGIVPIFFIPSVLKGSFAAMGNLGAKISGIGQKVGKGAQSKIRGSEGYKAAQNRGYARKTRIKAGLDKNYKPTALGNLKAKMANSAAGKALGYGALQRARVASARKEEAAQLEGSAMLGALRMEYEQSKSPSNTEDYLRGKLEEVADSKDDNAKFSVIDQMIKAGVQSSHIAQITRDVFGQKVQDKNFLEKFANRYGGGFLKKDFEQLDWARKGGLQGNTSVALGTLGAPNARTGVRHVTGGTWASANMAMDDMKDEDVAALSSDRLHELIGARLISQSQAQRIWASNTNMDDTNRLIMGAYGNAGMNISKSDAQAALSGTYAGTAAGLTEEMKRAYTERAAMDARLTDVEWKNRYGEHHQTDDLYADHREKEEIWQEDGLKHIYHQKEDGSWTDNKGNTFTAQQFEDERIRRRLEQQRQQQSPPPRQRN